MNIITNEPQKCQCYQHNPELYYTEEELRQQEEDWEDYEEPVDSRHLFIKRYHKPKDTFYAGFKIHKHGKGLTSVSKYRKYRLKDRFYDYGNDGGLSHVCLQNSFWESFTNNEEDIQQAKAITVDIDCGHSELAKRRAFDRIMDLQMNFGITVDSVPETYNGFQPVYTLATPVFVWKYEFDANGKIKRDEKGNKIRHFNIKQVQLLKDYKHLLIDILHGDQNKPGITLLTATPYLYEIRYTNIDNTGISLNGSISTLKEIAKSRNLISKIGKVKREVFIVARNCVAYTVALICFVYKKSKDYAIQLITERLPTLEMAEIIQTVRSAYKGRHRPTNAACSAYFLGRNLREAARNLNIKYGENEYFNTKDQLHDIRKKHYLNLSMSKKESTGLKIKDAVERINNDGLKPSIRLVSKYASISSNTVVKHRGISW